MKQIIPVHIWCQNDVVLTSMRRTHVASTLLRRRFYIMCPPGMVMHGSKHEVIKVVPRCKNGEKEHIEPKHLYNTTLAVT